MFGRKKERRSRIRPKTGAADTLITRDTKILGDISFKGVLYVDGHVTGNVKVVDTEVSMLTIGKNGYIEGEVEVPHVVVYGRVKGNVHASDRVELESSALIDGNVYYKLIQMVVGAEVNGQLVRDEQALLEEEESKKKPSVPEDKQQLKAVVDMDAKNHKNKGSRKEPELNEKQGIVMKNDQKATQEIRTEPLLD